MHVTPPTVLNLAIFTTKVSRFKVFCVGNSFYSIMPIVLKLYRCFGHGLKMCICFGCYHPMSFCIFLPLELSRYGNSMWQSRAFRFVFSILTGTLYQIVLRMPNRDV